MPRFTQALSSTTYKLRNNIRWVRNYYWVPDKNVYGWYIWKHVSKHIKKEKVEKMLNSRGVCYWPEKKRYDKKYNIEKEKDWDRIDRETCY